MELIQQWIPASGVQYFLMKIVGRRRQAFNVAAVIGVGNWVDLPISFSERQLPAWKLLAMYGRCSFVVLCEHLH